MLRSVQFPMETRSSNVQLGQHWTVLKARRDKVKGEVQIFLSQLPRVKHVLAGGAHNLFEVKLVRLGVGVGLDDDNLRGAMKGCRDAVAVWLGFGNDSDPRLRFIYRQQRIRVKKGRPTQHVRVEIRCLEPGGSVVRVLGEAPAELGAEAEQNPPPIPKKQRARVPAGQRRLPVRTAWMEVPWASDEAEEIEAYAGVDVPPATHRVPIPPTWRPATTRGFCIEPGEAPMLTLYRTDFTHPEVGLIWLYRAQMVKR